MGPLRCGAPSAELPAKLKVEVQAEFQIDILDYVPLADRRRFVLSGGTDIRDPDMAARHATPQILKDVFMEDLTHVLKPISSLFTEELSTTCNPTNAQISHQQTHSVVVPDGRTTEVIVDTAALSSNSMKNCSAKFPSVKAPSKSSCLQHTHSYVCNISHMASASVSPCCPVGHTGIFGPKFVIKTSMDPSDISASHPVVENLHKEDKLEYASNVSSEDDFDYASSKKGQRMLSDLCGNHHCDECTEFSQTSQGYSLQPSISCQAHTGGIEFNSEKNLLESHYSKYDGEAVGYDQDKSVPSDESILRNKTREFCINISPSGASCSLCQLPQNSTGCSDSIPQGNHESHLSCSQSVAIPELPVVSQSEACLSANNLILEPIPLLIKEDLNGETSEDNSSSQFYEATAIQNPHTLSGSPSLRHLHSSPFEVNDCEDKFSFRTFNLQEIQAAGSTGLDGDGDNEKVPVNQGNGRSSGDMHFLGAGMSNLQKHVELESRETARDQYPGNHNLEDLCKQTSNSPDVPPMGSLFAFSIPISPSRNDIDNVPEDASSHDNIEGKKYCCQTSASDVKSTVFGQKRVQLETDNGITNSSFSSSLLNVKMESAEWNYSEGNSQKNSQENLSSSTCSSELQVLGKKQAYSNANQQIVNSVSSAVSMIIKAEPHDDIAPQNPGKYSKFFECPESPLEVKAGLPEMVNAPVKIEITEEAVDVLDHIPLQERMEMLVCHTHPEYKILSSLKTSNNPVKNLSSISVADPMSSARSLPTNAARGCKRKRTATDSVETALEEDAPALLQVLIENGIDPKEIKLYEVMDDDGTVDVSSEDNFDEFENVILKLFSERPKSLFKLCKLRDEGGTKAAYCLACLISLIEQTHHMQLRNCPVEWGWCRDLQSFIFIFERHNRIVLERPEYGYATYFFEIVESFPIDWQIKRLVTTMKLAKYSRITLLEDKSLMIGRDLTEGEARILEEYGWKPNSGLGSLLNFCDRVVHDTRNETDNSDWRSKIGKLLRNGYDGGRIVMTDLPKKVVEYVNNQQRAIKLELDCPM